MNKLLSLVLCGLLCPIWAQAAVASSDITPEGCAPVVTVHKDLCAASIIYACGDDHLVNDFDEGKLVQQARFDSDWAMVSYLHFNEGQVVMALEALQGADMALSELISAGQLERQGALTMSTGVIENRVYGFEVNAAMTGRFEDVGGKEYAEARIERTVSLNDKAPAINIVINALIDTDRNLMLEGVWERSAFGGEKEVFSQNIRAVYSEGDAGFLVTKPDVGCD